MKCINLLTDIIDVKFKKLNTYIVKIKVLNIKLAKSVTVKQVIRMIIIVIFWIYSKNSVVNLL